MADLTPREPIRPLIWPDVVLDLADWLANYSMPVYVVGGAVRDALLHKPLKDLDLAAANDGVGLARRIANHLGGDFFVLDSERDVGRALVLVNTTDGVLTIDVARFRGADLLADLVDRDFTLNAMAVDLRGDLRLLIDPLGGQQDMKDKLIRRCAPHSVASDPIRALRAVRQSVQLGMRIEAETLLDIRVMGSRLAQTSPERIRDELIKMLALSKPASALRVADTIGLLKFILPEVELLHNLQKDEARTAKGWQHTLAVVEKLANIFLAISPARSDATAASFGLGMLVTQLDRFRSQLNDHINVMWPNERSHKALLVLAALLYECGESPAAVAAERAEALHLSNVEKQRLLAIIQGYESSLVMENLNPLAIHRFWWDLRAAGVDVCLLVLANYLGKMGSELRQDEWLMMVERARLLLEAYYERYDEVVEPPPLLDGNQLMQVLGLKPGPMIGQLIERIREAQVTGDVRSVEDALQVARAHLSNDG